MTSLLLVKPEKEEDLLDGKTHERELGGCTKASGKPFVEGIYKTKDKSLLDNQRNLFCVDEPLIQEIKSMSVVNTSCICMSINDVCTCIHLNGNFNKVMIKKVLTILRRPPLCEPGPSTSGHSSVKRRKLLGLESEERLKTPEIIKLCESGMMDSDDLDSDDISADETNEKPKSSNIEDSEELEAQEKPGDIELSYQNKVSASTTSAVSGSSSSSSSPTIPTPSMSSSSSPARDDNVEVSISGRNGSSMSALFTLLSSTFRNQRDNTPPDFFEAAPGSDDNDDEDDDDDDGDESWMDSLDSDLELTEDIDKVPNPEVLNNQAPKHTWFPLQEVVQRQYGSRTQYQSPSLFQQRYCGSLHAMQRLELMYKLREHRGCVNALDFHPRGNLLASAADDRKVVIWDWARGRSLYSYRSGHSSNVFQSKWLHLAGSTGFVVSSARDGMIRLADLAKVCASTPTSLIAKHKRSAHKLSVMRDTPHVILSVGEDGKVLLVDIRESCTANSKPLTVLHKGYTVMPLYSVASNPLNSQEFIVAGEDTQVHLFDRRFITGKNSKALKRFVPSTIRTDVHCYITSAVYNYCGSEILASYNDEKIYLFNAADGTVETPKAARGAKTPTYLPKNPQKPKNTSTEKSTNGASDNIGGAETRQEQTACQTADLTEREKGSKMTDTTNDPKGSKTASTNPKGSKTTSTDPEIGPQKPKPKTPSIKGYIHCYQGHRNSATVKGVNFLGARSEYVVSGSDDGYIYIWDRSTEAIVNWLRGDDHGVVNVIEPHPDTPVIATSGLDYNVKIWVPSSEQPPTFKGLKKAILLNEKKRDLVGSIRSVPVTSHLRWLWEGTLDSSLADADDSIYNERTDDEQDSDIDVDDPRQCTPS